jgi:4-amino-4-deoxy-L-arabinose transferase-like glycosyltransferase
MPLSAMLLRLRWADASDALYYTVLHFWALGGHSTPFLRLLALIFAGASLFAVYRLAAFLLDRSTAAWAVGILSASFLFITYAANLRTYSMLFLFCSLAALYVVRTMYTADDRAPRLFALWSAELRLSGRSRSEKLRTRWPRSR